MEKLGEIVALILLLFLILWTIGSVIVALSNVLEYSFCEEKYNVNSCVKIIVPNTEEKLIDKFKEVKP
jgi:hypothetical protein